MSADLPDDCVRLLDFQRGVIARWQLHAAGLNSALVDARLRRGCWRPLYRGVYATYTGEPPRECLLWAAVLRGGEGAALSHQTAAELDRLTDKPGDAIHVTVGHDRRVRISGQERHELAPPVVIHRSGRIDDARHPARTPPRTRVEETILDLTQLAGSFDAAFSWLSAGCGRRLVTPPQLHAAMSKRTRMRWHDEMLGALGYIDDGVHSNLEFRYARDVERAHGLPTAKRQARAVRRTRSQYIDNLYEEFGLIVELDGSVAHLVEDRWLDIHRDNFSARSGIITLRFSWADVTRRPCETAANVADVIQLRGWGGTPRRCGRLCVMPTSAGTIFSQYG
jgi:very-short-patch-repair endonuclease